MLVAWASAALCQKIDDPNLSFRAELSSGKDNLDVRWTNEGSRPLLLNLGSLVGSAGLLPAIRLAIEGPEIGSSALINTAQPGVIGGRAEFLVVCLPQSSAYTLSVPTKKIWLANYSQTLWDLRNRRWKVTVIYSGREAYSEDALHRRVPFDIVREYPDRFPFWVGTMRATVINRTMP